MKKKLALPVLLLLLVSCSENGTFEVQPESPIAKVQEPEGMMVLGEQLNNPYSVANMQKALETLSETRSDMSEDIEPNKLYVRFLPKDTADLSTLDRLELQLFDYPLDYDILQEGDYYHDPSIPDSMPTWQYTTVDVDFDFPDIQYEILEECYIPEYDDDEDTETRSANDNFMYALEVAAIDNAGLPEKYQVAPETRALGVGKKPSGKVTMENDCTGKYDPVKGITVRCHYLVNISNATTDKNGHYEIGHKYVCKPHYALVYKNIKDFTIWGNWSFVAAAQHSLGYHSKTGYDKEIDKEEEEWKWAVINNAAYDYYNMCYNEGILDPPSNLKIWCWPEAPSSSAPMLHHLKGTKTIDYTSLLITLFSSISGDPSVGTSLAALVRNGLTPDITIGMTYSYKKDLSQLEKYPVTPNDNYAYHYGVVWHELSHSSHFNNAGETIWASYINCTVKNHFKDEKSYGFSDDGTRGSGILGLGESWAYAIQRDVMSSKFSINVIDGASEWYCEYITEIKSLFLEPDGLSKQQIFDCLTKDVKSVQELKAALLKKYPSKAIIINSVLYMIK